MLTFHMGDTVITATRHDDGNWFVTHLDCHKKTVDEGKLSDVQFASVMALVIGGDDSPLAPYCFPIANPAVKAWSSSPIP